MMVCECVVCSVNVKEIDYKYWLLLSPLDIFARDIC